MKTKAIVANEPKYFVKDKFGNVDKSMTIKAVYESFNGWYWFITAYENNDIGYGYVVGDESEWGTFFMGDLKHKAIWSVEKSHWKFISHVVKA